MRCLTGIADEVEVDVQELFTYPGSEATDEEASHLDGELIDLEPVLRDAMVLELPFQPVCRPDCLGLCPDCGPISTPSTSTTTTTRSIRGGRSSPSSNPTAKRPRLCRLLERCRAPTGASCAAEHPPERPHERTVRTNEEKIVAVPKRRLSRSNTRHRRSQWKASVPTLVTCTNPACREKHLPHTACPSCGQYGPRASRRQVLES